MVIDLNRPFEILPLKLVPRAEWGAQAATSRERYKEYPIRWVVVRFTESEECFSKEECSKVLQRLQREQMEQGLTDIKHNFMVGGDWSVYEGRGWKYKAGDPLTPDVEGVCLDVGYIGPSPQIRQNISYVFFFKGKVSRMLLVFVSMGPNCGWQALAEIGNVF
ncbi:peptidoglycan-recognition protein SC2-like isoform X2 [Macrosteles quadrilineatus]|uniref:peptidoglycan-recognition protein SC2-like isoform X2 n=1 Tax=Macrosteles quadrilineatus TaxID=74068 RepID=UPI0023E1D5B1|nr:peptidoglycan-recognition protein SC2-like isoform X2 [Macrosteles quadrilineatus]